MFDWVLYTPLNHAMQKRLVPKQDFQIFIFLNDFLKSLPVKRFFCGKEDDITANNNSESEKLRKISFLI